MTRANQIGVSFSGHRGAVIERAGRVTEIDVSAGTTFVTGQEPLVWTRVREVTDAIEIYPDPGLLADLAAQSRSGATDIDITPASATRDAVVLGIAALLRRVHIAGGYTDVAGSTLAHRLALHVLTTYGGVRIAARDTQPGLLNRRGIERVVDLIDAELSDKLTLERLASAAALSPYHFARAFKASTGLAPHQFVTMRRIERAKALLTTTPASVTQVAHMVGFSNISHFRRLFRLHTGLTPGDLRRL